MIRMSLSVVLLLSFAPVALAQGKPSSGGARPWVPDNNRPNSANIPNPRLDGPDAMPRYLQISGRIIPGDGSVLEDRATIQSVCKGQIRTEAYSDSNGNFSFDFSDTRNQTLSNLSSADDSASEAVSPSDLRKNQPRDPRDCELKIVLAKFVSETIDLATRVVDFGHLNLGNIVVHRLTPEGGPTVNAKALPESARKEYFRGLNDKQKGKLDSDRQHFRKALDEYSAYASAWLEQGRVQKLQNDLTSARHSFEAAISSDSTLLPAYQELAQIQAGEQQWQMLADTTDTMLKLDSQDHPEFWFFNCVAKYHLGNLDASEKSAIEGVRVDTSHRVPKMECVLGIILMEKGQSAAAAEHFHRYLGLSPDGPESTDARKRLQQIEQAPGSSGAA